MVLSTRAPWNDILLVEQHRLSARRWHESGVREYLIGMTMSAPGSVEWRMAKGSPTTTCDLSTERGLFTVNTPVWWRQRQDADVVLVALDPLFVERIALAISGVDGKSLKKTVGFTDAGIESILLALRAELSDGCPGGRLYGESLATALVVRLMWLSERESHGHKSGGLATVQLRRILDYIDANLAGDTSLGKLAALIGLSERQFARLFAQSVRQTPHKYIVTRRVATAKGLLLDGQSSLAEISYHLGFPSQAHFTTTFRRQVGLTPKAFRKLRQNS